MSPIGDKNRRRKEGWVIRNSEKMKSRLLKAVGTLLAREGCQASGINAVARRGMEKVRKGVEILVSKGKMSSEEGDRVWGRIQGLTELEAAAKDADLVIEAIPEEMDLKKKTFREIAKIAPAVAILASNTSSLSITKIASATDRPDKVIGLHFFYPVPIN